MEQAAKPTQLASTLNRTKTPVNPLHTGRKMSIDGGHSGVGYARPQIRRMFMESGRRPTRNYLTPSLRSKIILHTSSGDQNGFFTASGADAGFRKRSEEAVLGKFICGICPLGGEIDAGSLRGAAVVIDGNSTGSVGHGRREHRHRISIGDLRHTTTRSARRSTVRGQPEEEVISSAGDIRIEKLRQSGAAGGSGSEKLLGEGRGQMHGAPGELEGVLPGSGIG